MSFVSLVKVVLLSAEFMKASMLLESWLEGGGVLLSLLTFPQAVLS